MKASKKLNKYVKKLRDNGYKSTEQRRTILKTLLHYPQKHFTTEELYEEAQKYNSNLGITTVYRNLEIFYKLNIVNKLNFAEDETYFELKNPGEHHHHMICIQCGDILEFKAEDLLKFEENLDDKYNFTTIEHYVNFYGYCQECQN